MLVPTAKLRYEMRFKALSAINLFQTLLQTGLTVAFAAAGFGVYAFVWPMPIVYLAGAVALWMIARPVVRVRNPFRQWRYLIGDSSYIFGQRVLQTATGQGDYIILGMLYGQFVLGPYFFAFGIAQQAARLAAGSIQSVLMAGLSRMPAFSPQQTQAALRATKALALIGAPLCMLQAAVAEPFLRALYGSKWDESIPLVQLISLGMAFDLPSWVAASLLQSRGQFRVAFIWSVLFGPIFIASMLVGALAGRSIGVATADWLYFTFASPILVVWTFRSSNVSWAEILEIYLRPVLIGIFSAGAALLVIRQFEAVGWPPAVQFAAGLCTGLLSALLGARIAMPKTWHEIMAKVGDLFPRLSASRT
jgi:PST family polysaccharide transporter